MSTSVLKHRTISYWFCTRLIRMHVPSVHCQDSRLCLLHRTMSIGHVPVRGGPPVFPLLSPGLSAVSSTQDNILLVMYPFEVDLMGSFLAVTRALGCILYTGQYLLVMYPFEMDLTCSFLAVTRALGCVLYTGQCLLVMYPFEVDLPCSPCCHQGSQLYPLHTTISIGPVPIRGGPHVFLLSVTRALGCILYTGQYLLVMYPFEMGLTCSFLAVTRALGCILYTGQYLLFLYPFEVDRPCSFLAVTRALGCILYTEKYLLVLYPFEVDLPCSRVPSLLSPGLSAVSSTQDNIYWSCIRSRWTSRVPSLLSPGLSAVSSIQDNIYWSCTHSRWTSRFPLAVTRALGRILYTGQYLLVLYPFEVDLTCSPCCHQGSRLHPLHRTISIGPVPIRGGPHVFLLSVTRALGCILYTGQYLLVM